MTRVVYVVGGAGTGKSTFMSQLLGSMEFGPFEDLHQKPNARGTIITLRGHRMPNDGLYLGRMREHFPGTDGLDRASSMTGAEWLAETPVLPRWIVGEGLNLATWPMMEGFLARTELLLIRLWADEVVRDLRFWQRGSKQPEGFLKMSETRSVNLTAKVEKAGGGRVIVCDSAQPDEWNAALAAARDHLG